MGYDVITLMVIGIIGVTIVITSKYFGLVVIRTKN